MTAIGKIPRILLTRETAQENDQMLNTVHMYLGHLILVLVGYGQGSNFSKLHVGFTHTKPIIFPHVPEIMG